MSFERAVRLVKSSFVVDFPSSSTDDDGPLYTRGQLSTQFTLVLSGEFELRSGQDGTPYAAID